MYREFDREGLVLIPQLQFSTPLPALEESLATRGTRAHGIELVDTHGQSWRLSRGSIRGAAPYYNPLDPRVQEAMLDVVRELVDRYHTHPSFYGVSVELSSNGFMQLPGLNWGYDDKTIQRFEKATGIRVPTVPGTKRFKKR